MTSDPHAPIFLGRCSCGKLNYTSKKAAKKAARQVQGHAAYGDKAGPLTVYRCARTNQWHIGHDPAKGHHRPRRAS